METACDRFFKTPELLDLLTSVLDRPCLARLCRTNRRFYRELMPSLYKNLDISGLEQKILISMPCLVALGRNIRHVRSLSIGPIELMFYYNCILALEELQWPISVAPVSASTRPHWLPPADCRTCQIVPLPPATNLRELTLTDEISDYLRYRMPMASDPKAVMAIFCWFVFLNPRLTRLTSGYDPAMDLSGCRLFANAVSKLTQLTDLDVVFYHDDLRFQIGSELFFSCCPSIRAFKLVFEDEYMNDDVTEWRLCSLAGDNADWTTVIRKQEPLANLEKLVLWDLGVDASTDAILAIFAHCPNIKTLDIDYFSEHYDHQAIGEFIGKECPKIQTLSCGSPEWELDVNGPLLLRILETLPTQQLEVMAFRGSFSPFYASSFALPIQRHSATLHTIHIVYTATIARISVAPIFEECINLKELDIDSGRQCEKGLFATLFDVLERPWNTGKLVKLSLAISGCELPFESEEQQPYYDRSAPISLSKAETDHFARLEELYRRVGLLVELEYLDLVMVILDAEGRINTALMNKRRNFPAMLTVGDPKTGRPGYLRLLQGLKNLRWLRGSVHADSAESTATMGLEECFWIHAHWPQIQSIELFPNNAQLRKPFMWLQAQRKNMYLR